ncbi:hypothetical protein [Nocardioides sp. URHA0032]|uniref:hypothetical protein n=1 Tax=Nocardioides sp. URHA0032 TaxID=1380388 RepID=UPI0012DE1069|nr:hypothetical protein [Nocardioides sp. URHA0032]
MLRANFNYEAPSYVDNFAPYVLDALARRHPQAMTEAQVAEDVRNNFGFTIPDRVVGTLLKRASRKNQVQRSDTGYVLTASHLGKVPDVSAEVAKFGRQQQEVSSKFLDFVSGFAPQHLHLVQDEPARHLSHFVEAHAAPLLSHALRGNRRNIEHDDMTGPDFLVNVFIREIGDKDATAFGYVVDLVKGAILAAVVDLGTGQLKRKLRDLHLVLDTPILLKALGFQGAEHQRATTQAIALAATHDAQAVCFPHTIKEVDGVLDSVVPVLRSRGARAGALREVDAHFLDKGSMPADIEIERGNLRNRIRSLGIREVQPPDNHYTYGLDEGALDALLEKHVHYRSPGTRRYDVDSLSAIHRLRKGSSAGDFEKCGFVLITDNVNVIRAARRVDERHEWPLAMHDADMAALLWVRSPAVNEDLPRMQLLATVYSGMQPGGHLWAKYLDEIERLQISGEVSEDDALLLRARPEARSALMTETLGEGVDIDRESIAAVLDRVRDDLQHPVKTQLATAELAREAALHAAQAAQQSQQSEKEQRESVEREVEDLRHQVASMRQAHGAQHESIRERAETHARRMVSVLIYGLGAVLVAGAAVRVAAPEWSNKLPNWLALTFLACGLLVFGVGAWRHFAGGSLREWARKVEKPLARRLERRARRRAGLPDAAS